MGKPLSKAMLIAALAENTQIDKNTVAEILESLTAIACREARNGFIIPGICKLKVISKKATQCRNPATGRLMQIGARDILKAVPLKAAKDIVTPKPENLITVIKEPEPVVAPETPPDAAVPPPPAGESSSSGVPPAPDSAEGQILFECGECKSMLSASPAEAGMEGQCPYCENPIRVPEQRAPLERKSAADTESGRDGGSTSDTAQDFVTTVCQTCSQEIEAPSEMVDMEVNCPSCSTPLRIPDVAASMQGASQRKAAAQQPGVDLSSMTIRIDLSDLE